MLEKEVQASIDELDKLNTPKDFKNVMEEFKKGNNPCSDTDVMFSCTFMVCDDCMLNDVNGNLESAHDIVENNEQLNEYINIKILLD